MFDELRYRWQLRKYLSDHVGIRRSFAEMPDDDLEKAGEEPRYKYTAGRELQWQEWEIARFRTKYLVEQAIKYDVPVPEGDYNWEQGARTDETVLTAAAAQKLRADIRAE